MEQSGGGRAHLKIERDAGSEALLHFLDRIFYGGSANGGSGRVGHTGMPIEDVEMADAVLREVWAGHRAMELPHLA